MASVPEPKYDTDVVLKGYLDKVLGTVEKDIENAGYTRNFGSQPTTPYYINDTYMNGSEIFVCVNTRLIGEFNSNDWEKAANYKRTFTTQPFVPYDIGDTWRRLDVDTVSYNMYICKTAKDEEQSFNEADWELIKENAYIPGSNLKIIGTSGVLTNLQYTSNIKELGEFGFIGALPEFSSNPLFIKLFINAYIPTNFVIIEAKITYTNIPVIWHTKDYGERWGYVRAMKAYKVTNFTNSYYVKANYYSEYDFEGEASYSELSAAFGEGYTPPAPSGGSHSVTSIVSGDIKASLTEGMNRIVLRANSIPETTGDYYLDERNCADVTSAGQGILNIIGYMSFS